LIGFLEERQQSVACRTVLNLTEPGRMLDEICAIVWGTFDGNLGLNLTEPGRLLDEICAIVWGPFDGNLGRAVRCLLSRNWAVLDATTVGLFPTLSTPVVHPLVAGVGITAPDKRGTVPSVDLAAMPQATWAYLLTPGAWRLRILRGADSRWLEQRRYTAHECLTIGERYVTQLNQYGA
jgi:hypothetical protein